MNRISSPVATLLALALSSPAVLAQTVTTPPQAATQPSDATAPTSDVRIVRLSQARGKVEMDRNTGNGFETAFPNLPVTQGAKLRTGEGVAEVEFEDNSTLRLAPDTVVEFPQLNRAATGATLSSVNVLKGTVYVGLAKTGGNTFTLTCDRGKIVLSPASHIRLDVGSPETSLAVFEGNAQLETTSGTTDVGKKKALLFSSTTQTTPTLVSKVDSGPFDDWDKTQTDFHKRYANASAFAGSPNLYGLADMNYYGAFADLPGCGRAWRPYFASAAWDPFSNGVWAWYPGTGYTWVSVYPWGWAPFRYGNWQQCGAGGWGWQPGGRWVGLHEPRQPHNPIHHPFPPRPPHPPTPGGSTLVAVNTKPLNFSKFNSTTSTFVFHNDSAGLGVPREAFGKLAPASAMAAQHGFVAAPVYSGYSGEGSRTGERGGYNSARSGQANSTASRSSEASTRSSTAASQSRSSASSSSSYSGGGGSHASYSAPASAPSAVASSAPSVAAPAHH
jgi:hypothetical protein